jgi:hypothetical protein
MTLGKHRVNVKVTIKLQVAWLNGVFRGLRRTCPNCTRFLPEKRGAFVVEIADLCKKREDMQSKDIH